MESVKSIENAVESLRPSELAEFRRWFAEFDGAPPGPYKVGITSYTSQSPANKAKQKPGDSSLGYRITPEKYASCDQSGLTAEVPAEGTNSLMFELKGPAIKFPK